MRRFLRETYLWVLLLPFALQFVGAASNQAVLIANHDKFPVMVNDTVRDIMQPDANGLIDKEHCVMTAQTHLNFLADIFDFHTAWVSIGDLLLDLGAWLGTFCPFVWGFAVIRKLYC